MTDYHVEGPNMRLRCLSLIFFAAEARGTWPAPLNLSRFRGAGQDNQTIPHCEAPTSVQTTPDHSHTGVSQSQFSTVANPWTPAAETRRVSCPGPTVSYCGQCLAPATLKPRRRDAKCTLCGGRAATSPPTRETGARSRPHPAAKW